MNSLYFFTSEDFNLKYTLDNNVALCHELRGYSLVLFYSTQCVFCQRLIPIFKRLPEIVTGCQFGMINVSTNPKILELARRTITPINYVPLIILYVNGQPYMRYDGPSDINEIKRFIFECSNILNSKKTFTDISKKKMKTIPAFTVGYPKCDDEKCYLEYDEAYQASIKK